MRVYMRVQTLEQLAAEIVERTSTIGMAGWKEVEGLSRKLDRFGQIVDVPRVPEAFT